jgi:hypothetical protein
MSTSNTTMQPANVYLTEDPDTPIPALHVAIIGDGKVHVTTTDGDTQSLTSYDAGDIDRIELTR